MSKYPIQKIWNNSYEKFRLKYYESSEQAKASNAILNCKTGSLGVNITKCSECGHVETHNNSCRNRNCPNCQALKKELWVDKRRAEVIDGPYFHLVFTLPHELNSLLYCNQRLLYQMLHSCSAKTIIELSANRKYLGATPGIIQVLHTWNQELNYHVHMHCIISGAGIGPDLKIHKSGKHFFIPVKVLRNKFRGKFMATLKKMYSKQMLVFSSACKNIANPEEWKNFCDKLYRTDWCPYIKETFNGFGNAIEYLGKYTHKIAISNGRIISVEKDTITFSARGIKPGDKRRTITLDNTEFIRRFLMHVLPSGFQKIRYYGILNNRMKSKNLKQIFKLQGFQRFRQRYSDKSQQEIIKEIWGKDICLCPCCGKSALKHIGRTFSGFS